MPELPEVETIRRDLEKKILHKPIVQVAVRKNNSVGGLKTKFVQALTGNAIAKIDRRGRLLIFWLKRSTVIRKHPVVILSRAKNLVHPRLDPSVARLPQDDKEAVALLCHLKMTGQLIYIKTSSPGRGGIKGGVDIVAGGHKLSEADIECLPNKLTRVVFVFADGSQLFFNDQRIFGYMKLASPTEVERALKKYGPEPIALPLPRGEGQRVRARSQEFRSDYFSSLFTKRTNTNLKALLLNQELIAGSGNIYVDEICFCAGVKPTRRVGAVTKVEQKKLFQCIPKILKEALKHRGTTFRNFLDSSGKKGNHTDFLRVYDRDGQPCKKCKTIVKKIRIAGRGTHYCATCQR